MQAVSGTFKVCGLPMCGNVRGNVNFRGDVPLTHIGNPQTLNVPETRLRLYMCFLFNLYNNNK